MNFVVDGAGLPITHLAAATLGIGVVGVSDVTVIVSDEFTDTVTELTDNPDSGIDLRTGLLSRTIMTPTGPTIVLNAPELGCSTTSFMERLLAHEGGRVLLEQRGEHIATPERPAGASAWPRRSYSSSGASPSRNIESSGPWPTSDTPKWTAPKSSTSGR